MKVGIYTSNHCQYFPLRVSSVLTLSLRTSQHQHGWWELFGQEGLTHLQGSCTPRRGGCLLPAPTTGPGSSCPWFWGSEPPEWGSRDRVMLCLPSSDHVCWLSWALTSMVET